MSSFTHQEVAALHALLEREKAFLQAGDVFNAVALAEEKGAAVQALEELFAKIVDGDVAAGLREKVASIIALSKENARHLESVRFGLQGLISRFQSIGADASIGTYNQYGDKISFRGASGGYQKKA